MKKSMIFSLTLTFALSAAPMFAGLNYNASKCNCVEGTVQQGAKGQTKNPPKNAHIAVKGAGVPKNTAGTKGHPVADGAAKGQATE